MGRRSSEVREVLGLEYLDTPLPPAERNCGVSAWFSEVHRRERKATEESDSY